MERQREAVSQTRSWRKKQPEFCIQKNKKTDKKEPFRVPFLLVRAGEEGRKAMELTDSRIAVIGIIIEDREMAGKVNELLHLYGEFIIGRMGIPYEKKQVNIISVVVDAPTDVISALAGKLGRLPGVSSKAVYSQKHQDRREGI